MQKYVLNVLLAKQADDWLVVVLTKGPKPKSLAGKICFPGGKVEAGESNVAASTREVLEEVGIAIPESDWHLLTRFSWEAPDDIEVLAAQCSLATIMQARTVEHEVVEVLRVSQAFLANLANPSKFTPTFKSHLSLAIEKFT